MDLRQIQYFLCLYEEGTATRAAKRLNIVQPALSMQIAKLEDEIGQRLFERSAQGMHPTPVGRQMYRLLLPIMRDLAHAREQLLQTEGELSGHVNIGMIASIAHSVLSEVLREFAEAHPKVSVTVTDGYTATLADWVTDGRIDAAIINKPRRPLGLQLEHIIDDALGLITRIDEHRHLPAEVAFAHAAALKLALPTRHHGLRGILESVAQAENIDLVSAMETDSIVSLIKLVETSAFASILPRAAVHRRLGRQKLQWRPIISPRLSRQVVCATHPRRPPAPACTAFINLLKTHIQGLESQYAAYDRMSRSLTDAATASSSGSSPPALTVRSLND